MKGRTICPKCKKEFVMEVPDYSEKHMVTCPHCTHSFVIKRVCEQNQEKDECGWEEHGEPRKTILSSLKKKTNRPMIASFLLLTIGVLGVFMVVIFGSSSDALIPEFEFITSYLESLQIDRIFLIAALVVFSLFALIGSITAYMRRYFGFTLFCAVLGIFSIGLFIGLVLSFIVIGLLFVSRDEFENAAKGKVF